MSEHEGMTYLPDIKTWVTAPAEGETCGTCQRRVPHKRKPTTPKTKRLGYQVPLDDVDSHLAVLDAAAFHLGVEGQPYARFKTLSLAAALVLQDESLKDFGRREAT